MTELAQELAGFLLDAAPPAAKRPASPFSGPLPVSKSEAEKYAQQTYAALHPIPAMEYEAPWFTETTVRTVEQTHPSIYEQMRRRVLSDLMDTKDHDWNQLLNTNRVFRLGAVPMDSPEMRSALSLSAQPVLSMEEPRSGGKLNAEAATTLEDRRMSEGQRMQTGES